MNGAQEKGSTTREKITEQRPDDLELWSANNPSGPLMNNGNLGFDATNGGFPSGMGFNGAGEFNQLMPFMQNSVPANPMGGFPNMMSKHSTTESSNIIADHAFIALPGMGIDPMVMSQGMYGGFGGQGLGINGMNIGMGYNAGQSAFGGFSGQPAAWNTGHDKFNQNAYGHATGMGGDFGTNAGYGRYNVPQHQGNFNQMHHHQYSNNDFQNGYNGPGFQNRGRGRGRGYQNAGRGRGYHQVTHGNQTNYEPFHHQIPQQLTQQDASLPQPPSEIRKGSEQPNQAPNDPPKAPDAEANTGLAADKQLAKDLEPGDSGDALEKDIKVSPANAAREEVAAIANPVEKTTETSEKPGAEHIPQAENEKTSPIEAFVPSDLKEPDIGQVNGVVKIPSVMMPPPTPTIPLGPAALYAVDQQQDSSSRGRGAGRGLHRGGADYHGVSRGRSTSYGSNTIITPLPSAKPIPKTDIAALPPAEQKGLGVEGAPKAPKALRDGLPNTSIRVGRGFSIIGRASSVIQGRPNGHTKSRRCVQALKIL